MDPNLALPLLDRCPPIAELPPKPKLRLAEASREMRFKPGQHIVSIVTPLRYVLIVMEGLAKLVGITEDGIERILYVYQPCEIIGSRILLEKSIEAPYEVVALEHLYGLAISKTDFMAVVREHPEALESVTRVLLHRVDTLTTWMLAAMSVDASLRLAKVLLDFADDEQPSRDDFVPLKYSLTHETMAQIIGASRPHTTTLLRDLEAEGAVRRLRPRGVLVSRVRLEEVLRKGGIGITPARG